jgi:SAM-dependent methyltransferase
MANWDERVPAHVASVDYEVEKFVADPSHLSKVVTFDLPRLGDIAGLRGVHLQCHIGTDTISLARLGASMTGLDFSPAAVTRARDLAARTRADAGFTEADVYDAVDVLGQGRFDLVYTGVGALCWLPGIRRWAGVVAGLLRPGGRLFLREGHPMLWALDHRRPGLGLVVDLPYFERADPVIWTEGRYPAAGMPLAHGVSHEWNHGLGEIVGALLAAGLALTGLTEHDSVPWEALPGQMTQIRLGEWRLTDRPWRLAHTYTLQAIKHDSR